MRFFIDGRIDTRPLDKQDVAALPLPYDDITLYDNSTALADDALHNKAFDDDDWGADKNFYISQFGLYVTSANNFMTGANEGIDILLAEVTATEELYFRKQLTNKNYEALLSGTVYILGYTYTFPILRKVLLNQKLDVSITNRTGQTLNSRMYVSGIPHV